jgi:(1->4)-alpha-D-glucan 1-alpha-D-glucosylmutase
VAGTTGYEFLNLLNGVFVDRAQALALDRLYRRVAQDGSLSFAEIAYQAKRLVMETAMASEIAVLAHRLNVISEKHRSTRDFTAGTIRSALREIIACFPVYRTYVGDAPVRADDPATAPVDARDREYVERAIAQAKRRQAASDVSVYDWIGGLLTLRFPAWATEDDRREQLDWVMRFQQLTGPVTAKGYEDTALYRYLKLVSLNEVGGDPSRFGTPPAEFHAAMVARQKEYPSTLSATATHDTKRGEDVRARINVLSEIPAEWRPRLARWHRLNRRHRTVVDGQPTPGADETYLIYQTVLGAWPIGADRLGEYVVKALREAKTRTSWILPNTRYEEALATYIRAILDPRRSREFLRELAEFHATVAAFGRVNGLAQTLVKIAAPGVPDFYQGTELWDLSLVDPDNRRPVDFALRERVLGLLDAEASAASDPGALARALFERGDDGRVKLFVTRRALACRRANGALFAEGEYRPLDVRGALAEHVLAFARVRRAQAAVAVVPRLLARLGRAEPPLGAAFWGEETAVALSDLGATAFVDALTGARVAAVDGAIGVGQILANLPVALLVADGGPRP